MLGPILEIQKMQGYREDQTSHVKTYEESSEAIPNKAPLPEQKLAARARSVVNKLRKLEDR